LPTDRPRPDTRSFHGADHTLELPKLLSEALTSLSRRENSTLFMTLFAAFAILLRRYSGQNDIVVGTPAAGRNRVETEELIGFFINTLVLRIDLSDNPSFCNLLRRVREVTLGAFAHQDLPFEMLVEELQPERSLSHQPLFQVFFSLQNAPAQPLVLPGLTWTPVGQESSTAKFDLTLFAWESEQSIALSFVYSTDLFDPATITEMAKSFEHLLDAIAAAPERLISTFSLVGKIAEEEAISAFNEPLETI
jgi:non-ribosomal peptide synthetase component F